MTVSKEQRVPRGRPKFHTPESRREYYRKYYKENREKWVSDYFCETCELYCSFVNKNRHKVSKFHLKKLEQKSVEPSSSPVAETVSQCVCQDSSNIDISAQ